MKKIEEYLENRFKIDGSSEEKNHLVKQILFFPAGKDHLRKGRMIKSNWTVAGSIGEELGFKGKRRKI